MNISKTNTNIPRYLKEICENCGFTKGYHHAGASPYPYDYCPGHANRTDWDKGAGTVFKPTGTYEED